MDPLPSALEELTPEWLTAALQPRFAGIRVETVALLDHQHGTNLNGRLRVRYANPVAGAPHAPGIVFVKLPPTHPRQRRLVIESGMGQREALFYERLAERVPMRVPAVYASKYDDATGAFAILIEDLLSTGCELPDGITGVGTSFAEQAMDDFAALHTAFPEDVGRDMGVPPLLRMREYGVGMLDHVLSGDTSSLTGEFCSIARLYIDAFDALHDLWEAGNLSVVHGDGHATNLFLDHRRAGFFDWGCFSLAPPMRDVSYFLCMALGIEHRRALERPLIERYLARRAELGSPGPSIEDAWEQHRLHAGYTVVAAAPAALYQGGVTTADPAYSRAFVERAGAAVADLDSVAALRATIGR